MKHYRILNYLIISVFCLFLTPTVFAEAPVSDDSQNYATNNGNEADSDQQPVIHDDQDASANQDNYMQHAQRHNSAASGNDTASDEVMSDSNSQDPAILLSKLHALQQQIQQMRGQLEVQGHQIQQLQQQQQSYYKDLDSRISGANKSVTTSKTTTATTDVPATITSKTSTVVAHPSSGLSSVNEQASYAAAYELLKNKKFDQAIVKMNTFLQEYPTSSNAVNAHYWLGELYLAKHQSKLAINEFNVVLQKYPGSLKSDAAMLKLGFAYADSGNYVQAKHYLTQVIQRFPNSTSAKLAANRLAVMKQAGNRE